MKQKQSLLAFIILTIFVCVFLAACSGAEAETEPDSTAATLPPTTRPPATTAPATEPAQTEPADDFVPTGNVNPLTGLCDGIPDEALGRRPLAIMVGNSRDSLPQWGISQADIIYEMLAEGRITRFLAIFQSAEKIEKLASVRSARPYYIDIAQSYGAIYVHHGGSVPGYEAIAARSDLINIDGMKGAWEGSLLHRDAERRKMLSMEHSLYLAGANVAAAYEKIGASKDISLEGSPSAFNFHSQHSALSGKDAARVQYTYSSSHRPYFEYDAENGTYLRFQYDAPQMDGLLKKQIEVKNLLVIRMQLTDVPNSTLKLVEIQTTGSGEGFYFCEGKYIEITWKKEKYNTPITYYTQDGKELVCARGKTFVSVITTTADIEIE